MHACVCTRNLPLKKWYFCASIARNCYRYCFWGAGYLSGLAWRGSHQIHPVPTSNRCGPFQSKGRKCKCNYSLYISKRSLQLPSLQLPMMDLSDVRQANGARVRTESRSCQPPPGAEMCHRQMSPGPQIWDQHSSFTAASHLGRCQSLPFCSQIRDHSPHFADGRK